MGDKCVDERSVGISRRGMHHKTGRFVDDDQVIVFVHDHKGNILRLWLRRLRCRKTDRVGFARFDPQTRLSYGRRVAHDGSGVDQGFQSRTAEIGKRLGEEAVETQAGLAGRNGNTAR